MTEDERKILNSFIELSGLDPTSAEYYLQITGWDVNLAFTLLSDNNEINQNQQNFNTPKNDIQFEENLRAADPTQTGRLIEAKTAKALEKEQILARLEDESVNWMFLPPRWLSNPYSLAEVRKIALAPPNKKWILINIQDHLEFSSHLLNRDVWTNETLVQHIQTNLIFWQRGSTSIDGKKFLSYYHINPGELPLVGIVDPRTGGLIWVIKGTIEADDLLSKLLEFEEANQLDSMNPINVRKTNQPTNHLNQTFEPKIQSSTNLSDDYDESENYYQAFENNDEDNEEGEGEDEEMSQNNKNYENNKNNDDNNDNNDTNDDDESLALALELSKQLLTEKSDLNSNIESENQINSNSIKYSELIDEPSPLESDTTKISFRFIFTPPSSTSNIRRFSVHSTVEQCYSYVYSLLPLSEKDKKFDLLTPFPRESISSKINMTIQEAGLSGSQLIMKWE